MSGLRGTDVAIEDSWQERLIRYWPKVSHLWFKVSHWILLVVMLAVATEVVKHGENPYITFPVVGGIYVLVEAGRWLPFLVSAPLTRSMLRISAWSLVDLAVLLTGRRRRLALRQEWLSHLAGESGHDPVTWPKVRQAFGFVTSAIQCRFTDAADAAWAPINAILKSRTLSNLLVFGLTAVAALYILRHLGTLGVITSAESIIAIGGVLYGLIRVGRWWRNVKPPEPKARRAKE